MSYKLTNSSPIVRIEDGAFIPADPANIDYAAYLTWLAEGNTPQPVDPVVPTVPEAVTKRKAILDALGLTEAQLNSLLRLAGTP